MEKREIIGGILFVAMAAGAAAMTQVGATVFPFHEDLIFWMGCCTVVVSAAGLALLMLWPSRREDAQSGPAAIRIGKAEDCDFDGIRIEADRAFDIGEAKRVSIRRLRQRKGKK
jgi:hypothetical protein